MPFLAFILALTNYSQREAKNVVYLFLIYYGATNVVDIGYYIDAAGYALQLERNSQLPFSHLFEIFTNLYSDRDSIDLLEPLLSFFVSRFTTDHRALFAVFAAIFGFFYLGTINKLHDVFRKNPNLDALIMLAFFAMLLPVMAISGFRMWTAAWIFVYGGYHVVVKKDMRYLILTFAAIFVHWSFFMANGLLIIYVLVGNREVIYIPLTILSFIVPYVIAPFMTLISLRMGGVFQDRYSMYSDESYAQGVQEQLQEAAWFMTLGTDMVLYFLLLALVVIRYKFSHIMSGKGEKSLFCFSLLMLTFVNFGKTLPSLGGRFQLVFFLFATMYVFLFFTKKSGGKRISYLTAIGLFPMLVHSAVVFRQGSDTLNAWLFAPGLGIPFFVQELSLALVLF
ncbi:hypothetical protein JCM21142_41916 [Saccharicrinis fermentans DSM 9555 = JCM 21142]|uniref:EpsG family protein n=1 Tax=Saccharicrinis fermentans DSM 9555 = JCM 21142 TaxID=869213 RepID=W7YLJ9_9BACT|nr:hypothetical protein JCM21142_41916 [Saccharicrinis fermentans DSM 9555 = JCM 21142]